MSSDSEDDIKSSVFESLLEVSPIGSDSELEFEDGIDDADDHKQKKPTASGSGRQPTQRRSWRRMGSGRLNAVKLNANLKGLMGEANVQCARGNVAAAERMCFEIMRQQPNAHEPYLTLAQIYEDDPTKCEGYLTMATFLCPSDDGGWSRLAELAVQQGKMKQGINMYSRAIHANPTNMQYHERRWSLMLEAGLQDDQVALHYQLSMAKHMPIDGDVQQQQQQMLDICKQVAHTAHQLKRKKLALHALKLPFVRCPELVATNHDLINQILEMQLSGGTDSIEILNSFTNYCDFNFHLCVAQDTVHIEQYNMPPTTTIDIKVKFCVLLIKMQHLPFAIPLIEQLLQIDDAAQIDPIGDLFLDLAETLMVGAHYQWALKLFVPLVKHSKQYNNLAAVWLKYAECLCQNRLYEQAVEAYFTVLSLAPQHIGVLHPLAMTLLKLGRRQQALDVMSLDLTENSLDVAILMERIRLWRQIGDDWHEYWRIVELLLARHCYIVRNRPYEIRVVAANSLNWGEKTVRLQRIRDTEHDTTPVTLPQYLWRNVREPNATAEYEFLKEEVFRHAYDAGHYWQLFQYSVMALSSRRFRPYFSKFRCFLNSHNLYSPIEEILIFVLLACIHVEDTYNGHTVVRELIVRDSHSILLWNLLNVNMQCGGDVRNYRFVYRFQKQRPEVSSNSWGRLVPPPPQTIDANYAHHIGNYNAAIQHYMAVLYAHPHDPYAQFILAVIILQTYTRRRRIAADERRKLAEIAADLMHAYATNRRAATALTLTQEVHYNLGRLYHQLGVPHLAEKHYSMVLETALNAVDADADDDGDLFDLKMEAAYNLHLIYLNSGNTRAARNILIRHITIANQMDV